MWNKILYLDYAAVPVYLTILYTTVFRKMTRGRTNVMFLVLVVSGFLTVVGEIVAGQLMQEFPLSSTRVLLVEAMETLYFWMRHTTNVVYVFFIFAVTRSWYRLRAFWKRFLLSLPYLTAIVMLVFNGWTGAIFIVPPELGYQRGHSMWIAYGIAAIYMVFGTLFLCSTFRILEFGEWMAMISMYALNVVAVAIQFVKPDILIECFATSQTLLFVVLFVQRPEKQIDINTGLRGYRAFCEEIRKISVTGQDVQILMITIANAAEMSGYLGKKEYNTYIHSIDEMIAAYAKKERLNLESYFEQPGSFYIILEDPKYNPVQGIPEVRDNVRKLSGDILKSGVQPDLRIVNVHFPEEVQDPEELFRLGHSFPRFVSVDKIYSRISTVICRKEYQIEARMDEILDRAVNGGGLQISYEPVWSVKEQRMTCADAVLMLYDDELGEIDGELLYEAAEERGLVLFLDNYVMEQVFAAAGSPEFDSLGYSRINLRLSITSCMQISLTDRIWELRERFDIHPERIGFAIRESIYENMSAVMDENLRKLSLQGYKLILDGYGRGYSNLQRILELPVKSVRLDRRMLEVTSEGARAILRGSIRMLKEIPLEVIAQGVDDEETKEMLISMGCEKLQGRCFS